MTDKQTIIDGVDVSGCKFYNTDDKTCREVNGKYDTDICEFDKCENSNCYFKQLARKTQERDELKHNYNAIKQCNDNNMQTLDEAIKEKHEIECELEKVKKQYKCYSCGTCNGKEDYYNLAGHHENAIKSLHKTQQQLSRKTKECEQKEKDIKYLIKCLDNSFKIQQDSELYWEKERKKLKAVKEQAEQKLERIRDIAEPYKMTIKKICKNCKKYDSSHACCYKDISCYKYTSPNANACDEFTYLDKLIPNIISNQILQIIDEVDNEN